MEYDIKKNAISVIYSSYIFLSDKFAYLISYAEPKARPPSAPNVVIWVFCSGKNAESPTYPISYLFALYKSDICLKIM